jgi:DNA primase large subunit
MWEMLMGYLPKMTRVHKEPQKVIRNVEQHKEINIHLPVLMIRKSSRKLQQYCDCFVNSSVGVRELITLKYEISKCRAEVISILFAMAKDPERFEIGESLTSSTKIVDKETGVAFNYYNFVSGWRDDGQRIRNPSVYINGEQFLNADETMMMARVFESLKTMQKNEYKLQEELKTLEEQTRVFEIYKN